MFTSVWIYIAILLFLIFSVTWADENKNPNIEKTRTECEVLNKTIGNIQCINMFKTRFQKFSAFNLELLVQADRIMMMVTITKGSVLTNQYPHQVRRINTPICEMLRMNLFGSLRYTTTDGNFTLCPIKPGFYHLTPSKNTLGDNKEHHYLPKQLPPGDYKVDATLSINESPFIRVILYISYYLKL